MATALRSRFGVARGLVFVAVLLMAGWLLEPVLQQWLARHAQPVEAGVGVPVVMRTPGGLLEVASLRIVERFKRSDAKELWGIDLGTTVSMIQVPAVYRYHIPLAPEWSLSIRGTVASVRAPALQPSLPVAIDTSAMEKYSNSGWARFNRDESLDVLERSITPQLERKARSTEYRDLATETARQTVREYVTQWLLREHQWKRDAAYQVEVVFPNDPPKPAQARSGDPIQP
jgi:hypothetical protein